MSWAVKFEQPPELVAGAEFGGGIYYKGNPDGFQIADWMRWSARYINPGDGRPALQVPETAPGSLVGTGIADTNLPHTQTARNWGGRLRQAPIGAKLVIGVGLNPDGSNRDDLPNELRGRNFVVYTVVESRAPGSGGLGEVTRDDFNRLEEKVDRLVAKLGA